MDIKRIRELIQMVEASDIDELDVSRWGHRVRVIKRHAALSDARGPLSGPGAERVVEVVQAVGPVAATPASASEPVAAEKESGARIESPMVGTFYSAPSPDARSFVEVGDTVEIGQVVCIIEAMKLMNEIKSEVAGRIAKVMATNADPVEYGQTLFLVK